jgi:hypothetical protein
MPYRFFRRKIRKITGNRLPYDIATASNNRRYKPFYFPQKFPQALPNK